MDRTESDHNRVPESTIAEAEYLLHLVEEKGTGPDAASLLKKLRRVWSQREAHNVICAMARKRERTL